MRTVFMAALLLSGILASGISEAVETNLVIRARSKDAKFIGTKMGGARVIVTDSETGKVLAQGFTSGGTGDTGTIMMKPKARFSSITIGAAQFTASIDIDEPRLITIDVEAPYVYRENMIKSSTQLWVIPGRDITGEGIIIEVPGFAVEAQVPDTVTMKGTRTAIPLQAEIVMI